MEEEEGFNPDLSHFPFPGSCLLMQSAGLGCLFLKGIRYCHTSIRHERVIRVAIALMLCFTLTPLFGHPSPIVAAAPVSFTLDFESGNYWGWEKVEVTGTSYDCKKYRDPDTPGCPNAFDFQPTFGDNPTARGRGQPSHHQGNWWIGTYEQYQGLSGQDPGDIQGDGLQGILESGSFVVEPESLSFLVGGGSAASTRVEFQIFYDGIDSGWNTVYQASGKNTETMERVTWDLSPYTGKTGRIRIVDFSSGSWGHINADDFRFSPKTYPPKADFTMNPPSGHAPLTVNFTDMSTGSPTAWSWSFGDGKGSSVRNPSHTYLSGSYTVTLTVSNAAGSASISRTVDVGDPLLSPVARIDATPESGRAPLLVRFDGTQSSDPDGTITSYQWDFGDDTTAAGAIVDHTYTRSGEYRATLSIMDNQGQPGTVYVTIHVGNTPPIAVARASPTSGPAPLTVSFDAAQSYDPDGRIVSYQWDFGDGSREGTATAIHQYKDDGSFTAVLTVTDDKEMTGRGEAVITVGNDPPVASIRISPQKGSVPLRVTFDGSQSYDPEGNDLTFSWDFGDGASGSGMTAGHTYGNKGTYRVSLLVTDSHGSSDRAEGTVEVEQPFPLWPVVIGGLCGGIVIEEILRRRPHDYNPGDRLPEKFNCPKPPVHVDVRSGVECSGGKESEVPDITVDIRSGIWKEGDER